MPPRIHPSTLNRAWAYIKSNYINPNIEHLTPNDLLQTPRVITSLDQSTHLPKVDLTNPRVLAARINARATIFATKISMFGMIFAAIIGTTAYAVSKHDKTKGRRINTLEEEATNKDTINKIMSKKLKEQVLLNIEQLDANKELMGQTKEIKSFTAEQSDVIIRQHHALQKLDLLQEQIKKCEQSMWCSFFLKQTAIQSRSKPTEQPQKETVSHHRKP